LLAQNPEIMLKLIDVFPELFNFKVSKQENSKDMMWKIVPTDLVPLKKKYQSLSSNNPALFLSEFMKKVFFFIEFNINSVLSNRSLQPFQSSIFNILAFCFDSRYEKSDCIVNDLLNLIVNNYSKENENLDKEAINIDQQLKIFLK
jgi:hypothetical protein